MRRILFAALIALALSGAAGAVEREPLLYEQLRRHEGYSPTVYELQGSCMVGVGHKIACSSTICLGEEEADEVLRRDVRRTAVELDASLPWWRELSIPRQAVVVNMAFSMGTAGLMKWERTLLSIREGRYADASRGMRKSLWARQTGGRARELAKQMRSGKWQRTHNAN